MQDTKSWLIEMKKEWKKKIFPEVMILAALRHAGAVGRDEFKNSLNLKEDLHQHCLVQYQFLEQKLKTAEDKLVEARKATEDAWGYALRHPDNAAFGIPSIRECLKERP
jgi:hypothetical protein